MRLEHLTRAIDERARRLEVCYWNGVRQDIRGVARRAARCAVPALRAVYQVVDAVLRDDLRLAQHVLSV
jgi:hypothetical protein